MALHRATKTVFLKTVLSFCVLICGLIFVSPAQAADVMKNRYAAYIVDANTGRVLTSVNADDSRYPASLTKMMTLYITFIALQQGRIHLNDMMPISRYASSQSPSKLGLRPGQTIKVEHAILGLVTESANDAAVTLAEYIGGSESNFARMMTETARRLGMNRTRYQNASGLPDPDQRTTARDQATLGRALIAHFPQYYRYFSTTNFVYAGQAHANHNHLMSRYEGMDGIKTGFIRASGFNLVASASRGNTRLVAAVFGGTSAYARDQHMAGLLDDAFDRARQAPSVRSADANPLPAPAVPAPTARPSASAPTATAVGTAAPTAPPAQQAPTAQIPAPTVPTAPAVVATAPTSTPMAPKSQAEQLTGQSQNFAAQIQKRAAEIAPQKPAQKPAPRPVLAQGDGVDPEPTRTGWAVQVGAFRDRASGTRAITSASQKAADVLGQASPHIVEVSTASGRIFRARLGGLNESAANTACNRLIRAGMACLLIPPDGL
jgi:D-alanyl-D-alanine carboxypeptidase